MFFPLDSLPLKEFTPTIALEIKATRLPSTFLQTPLAGSSLTYEELTRGRNATSLHDPLTLLPGVFVLNGDNYAQDLRVSVRGFGARAAFGIRGVQLVVDGIPESTPDGQAEVDNIDPAALQKLEILRSPAAGMYGNASGGVLLLETALPDSGFQARAQAIAGAFGLQRFLVQAGGRIGDWTAQGVVSRQQMAGYRTQSAMQSTQATFKGVFKPHERTQLTLLLSGVDSPFANDPGGLTAGQARENPRQARAQALTYQTGESVRHARAGLLLQKKYGRLDYGGRLFGALRRLDNRLPFTSAGAVELRRAFAGAGVFAGYSAPIAGGAWRAQAGLDAERQSDDRARYDNLQGVRGPLALDQQELFDKIGLWTVQQWTRGRWSAMGSLRADQIRVQATDRFFADGDQSGARIFRRLSPMLGLNWQPAPNQSLYANIAGNFETPTLNELSSTPQNGGFAPLRPQRARSVEIGFKQAATRVLQAEIALFHIRLRDEIVSYQLPEFQGRNFFRNAGRSQRTGLELGLHFFPAPKWSARAAYTYSDFRYTDYIVNGQSFNGRRLPGLPRSQVQGTLQYRHKGLLLAAQSRYIGAVFVNDANDEQAAAVWLFHLRSSWAFPLKRNRLEITAGVQNLLNRQYPGNILINAAARRYYEPGAARNGWLGLTVSW
jgi:iron complex outermembrane receptor protein